MLAPPLPTGATELVGSVGMEIEGPDPPENQEGGELGPAILAPMDPPKLESGEGLKPVPTLDPTSAPGVGANALPAAEPTLEPEPPDDGPLASKDEKMSATALAMESRMPMSARYA